MSLTYAGRNHSSSDRLHPAAFPAYEGCKIMLPMSTGRIYLKEWRKFRHLIQRQVVERLELHDDDLLPATEASLSRLENGRQPYSQRVLEALGEIYSCEPSDLLGRNPFKEGELIDLVSILDERQREQAKAVLEALRVAGN